MSDYAPLAPARDRQTPLALPLREQWGGVAGEYAGVAATGVPVDSGTAVGAGVVSAVSACTGAAGVPAGAVVAGSAVAGA